MRPLRLGIVGVVLIAASLFGGFASRASALEGTLTYAIPSAPPPMPYYAQPPLPAAGHVFIPGHWAWDSDAGDYYWVPGYWTRPPEAGMLWTPGYWAWRDKAYVYSPGYWSQKVGFYGGVNYGFGYNGVGFSGARWSGGVVIYNLAFVNASRASNVRVYKQPPAAPVRYGGQSFSGGPDGLRVEPTQAELASADLPRLPPTVEQVRHDEAAAEIPSARFAVNAGLPPVAAVPAAGAWNGEGVIAAGRPPAPAATSAATDDASTSPTSTATPSPAPTDDTGLSPSPQPTGSPLLGPPSVGSGPASAFRLTSSSHSLSASRPMASAPRVANRATALTVHVSNGSAGAPAHAGVPTTTRALARVRTAGFR